MKLPFSEVWLLNLAERPDRYKKMRERIDYMGWDVKDIIVVEHPTSNKIVDKLGEGLGGIGHEILNGGIYNITREQYTIIKSAYLRGVKTVGIIEDDTSFLKDLNMWEEYMRILPKNWNVLRVGCLRGMAEHSDDKTPEWVRLDHPIYGNGFYILDRKAMKYYIDSIDNHYVPADIVFSEPNNDINIFIPKHELCLNMADSLKSSVRVITPLDMFHMQYKSIQGIDFNNYI